MTPRPFEEFRQDPAEIEAAIHAYHERRKRPPRPRVEIVNGVYACTSKNGNRVEVTLVNPDARRWQVEVIYSGVLPLGRMHEWADDMLEDAVKLGFGPKGKAASTALLKRIRRDYPASD